jgi:hypothetical protein
VSQVNFSVAQAFSIVCDVCGDRHVGGQPDDDRTTEEFMRRHAKWHETSSLVPPRITLS